jgi:parallel beta-helix repeat protein
MPSIPELLTEAIKAHQDASRAGVRSLIYPVYNVKGYGAVGDGTTDDTEAIEDAIAAASTNGGTVFFPETSAFYSITDEIAISSACSLMSDCKAEVKQATAGKSGFVVTASNVSIINLKITGPQCAAVSATEYGIKAYGADVDNYITNLRIEDCEVNTFGIYGIRLDFVSDFIIRGNYVHDIYYGGIMVFSGSRGEISNNSVIDVEGAISTNAYGIALSKSSTGSTATHPRSEDILVSDNYISNVTVWEGLDAHAGLNITFRGNVVKNCMIGIAVIPAALDGTNTYGPANVVVDGNICHSTNTSGSGGRGIILAGTTGELAYGCVISNNSIINHGLSTGNSHGGFYIYNTKGAVISNNSVINPTPHGAVMYNDNYGFSMVGNSFVDPWTSTAGTQSVGVYFQHVNNQGTVSGNAFCKRDSTAAYNLDYGIRIATSVGNLINLGPNQCDSTTYLVEGTSYQVYSMLPNGGRCFRGTTTPSTGTYYVNDQVLNTVPTTDLPIGWVCVTGSTAGGTWKTFGAIA